MPGINIVLEATSHPDFGDIHIEQSLYPIGRDEAAFASMDAGLRSKLSRRHARIFVEDHKAYLADLDSSNGTVINGKALSGGSPIIINDGDLVTFSSELSYRVNLIDIGADTEAKTQSEEALILQPLNPEGHLDTLVINQFPFLIGRKDSVLEAYGDRFPDETAHLSRRHAVITFEAGTFQIEDLGSKNGTELNGLKLDEHSKILSQGDTVSFGNDFFAYSVDSPAKSVVSSIAESAALSAPPSESDNSSQTDASTNREKTLFVDSPTSFLEIFCGEEENSDADAEVNAALESDSGASDGNQKGGKLQSAGNKARAIGEAFMGERESRSRVATPLLAGFAAALVLIVIIILYPSEKDRIDSAFERGNYLQSAMLADAYLADHPDDSQIEEQGTKAILKALMPQWLGYLQQGDYARADQHLEDYRAHCSNIPDALDAINLLRWVGALNQFMAENDGPAGPIDIFEDELAMAPILETWDQSPNRHQQVLSLISSVEPEFKPLQKEAMSRIRQLDHSFNSHKKTISTLSETALEAIQNDNMTPLYVQLTDIRKNYPRLRGLDRLENDAELYEERNNQLKEADIGVLVTMQGELVFQTDIFTMNALPRIMSQLPDDRVSSVYSRAVNAWQQGESELAINTLRQLDSDNQWSDKVRKKINRFESIASEFAELQANPDASTYPEQLLGFRGKLDSQEDIFYLEATSSSFEVYKDQFIKNLQEDYVSAKTRWSEYEDAGGISSVMRIEDPITDIFRQQCTKLKLALVALNAAVNTYRSLHLEMPADVEKLYQLVNKEVKRQRSWINDLAVVLDEDLLHEKLLLLPKTEEDPRP